MKSLLLLSVLLTCGIAPLCGSTPVLIQDFEKPSSLPSVWVVNIPYENASLELSTDRAHDGKQSLELHYQFTGGGQYLGITLPVKIKAPIHKLRLWLYGDGSASGYGLYLSDASGETHKYRNAGAMKIAFKGWKEITVDLDAPHESWGGDKNGKIDYPITGLTFEISGTGKPVEGDLFFDTIVADAEQGVVETLGRQVSVVSPDYGSDVQGDTRVTLACPGFKSATVKCWKQGREFGFDSTVASLALDAKGAGSFVFPADAYPHGPIVLRISGSSGAVQDTCYLELFNKGGVSWNEPFSPFGIGSDAATGRMIDEWMPPLEVIGIRKFRCAGNVTWGAREGTWSSLSSRGMDYLFDHHIAFCGLLYGAPAWNKLDAPGSLPVHNLRLWSDYVRQVVKRAGGKVKYFEVWNEPPNGIGRGQTAADYAKIMIASYDAAHAVDPTCMVGMAAKSVHVNWLEQTIKAGAKGHFDYITLHPYETAGCTITHPGSELVYLQIAGTVRKMLAARDPAKVNCPIAFTEVGFAAGGPYSARIANFTAPEVQGQALVKYFTMGIAQGIAWIDWFEGHDGDSGPMGLLDAGGKPRPSFTAMAQMIKHFGQHPAYLGWVLLNDKHYGFVFQGAKGTVLAAWASTSATDNVDFGQPVEIVDPLTGNATQAAAYPLTLAPILVIGVPDNLVERAKGNKAKPFPWGGDYSDAKSVSVTYGEKNVEKGLHTQSAESIAKDVVAYGGSARSGTVPGGNVFMVDPNFLSYTATPIEISVVVRRNAANDPATLRLTYESTSGYKNAEPYPVPDNKEWHTAKWKIDDAQFVSMWAYNFSLNSGNYCIQSVTVTKRDK